MSVIFWLACTLPTYRESFELISLLDNGQIFEARFTKGDTGLFKGQAHLRINRWLAQGTPMSYHIDIPPSVSELQDDGIDFLGYRFYKEADTWLLYIRSEEYNVSGQIRPKPDAELTLTSQDWTVKVLDSNANFQGWSSALGRSGLLNGNATLFHRYGEALLQGERQLLIAFGSDDQLGIEYSNIMQQSWGQVEGKDLRASDISLQIQDDHVQGRINNTTVLFTPTKIMGQEDLYDHLTKAERWLGSTMISTHERYIMYGNVIIAEKTTLPAIYIYQGTTPPKIPLPKKQ